MEVKFRPMTYDDWEQVSAIYRQGIETGVATFEIQVPSWKSWDAAHLKNCRIVSEVENIVVGWAALSPVSSRKAYEGVAEVSIYISNDFKGKGIGSGLMKKLVDESEIAGFWTLQAGIFRENVISIKLHQDSGFRIVGYRERIAQLNGIWKDTVLLERRTPI
jgi:phosphinothricin acetyltransferase